MTMMITMTTIEIMTMTMTINLKIKSTDSYKDEILEDVVAQKKVLSESFTYFYSSEIGETELTFFGNRFKMERKGQTLGKLYFLENGLGNFYLEAYGLKESFKVKNGKLVYNEDKITVSYDLYKDNEIVNSLNIHIFEK